MTLINTKWKVILPGGLDAKEFEAALPKEPGYQELNRIIAPLLGGKGTHMEHVSVWADYKNGTDFRQLDMFVDENGLFNGLPRNEEATTIYRRANQMGLLLIPKEDDPETLNFIVGPAVLFSRRVWF